MEVVHSDEGAWGLLVGLGTDAVQDVRGRRGPPISVEAEDLPERLDVELEEFAGFLGEKGPHLSGEEAGGRSWLSLDEGRREQGAWARTGYTPRGW